MSRIRLLHWSAPESQAVQKILASAGHDVEYDCLFSTALMRQWRLNPPDAFVIDLSRLPSQGREIAIGLRQSPKTRHVPIVFCNGDRGKVKLIRDTLPDAVYCESKSLAEALQNIHPVVDPVKPLDMMNRYGSRTTAQKLGIKPGATLSTIHAPRQVEVIIGDLPKDVEFVEEGASVTLHFVNSVDELRYGVSRMRHLAAQTKYWILWKKRTAPGHTGVTDTLVREAGIAVGLVDYKVCSVDSTWTAMLFAVKK